MEKNKAELFLDALRENAEVRAYMADYAIPEGMDKENGLIAVAAHFGYEITKEELEAALEKQAGVLDAARQAAEAAVEELSVDDLDNVAGGGGVGVANQGLKKPEKENDECKSTYQDAENCWYNDGCDNVNNMYTDYLCNHMNFKL